MSDSALGQRCDFRSLFDELAGVALWTVPEPGEFGYISDGFEGIWGISPETVKDDPDRLLETIHPEDRERVRKNIDGSISDLQDTRYENRVVQPDGSVRWVLTQQVLIRDDAGDISEIVGICTDITEQKRREQELELLNRIVRHDIRNDMAVVLGWAEMLDGHVDAAGETHLQKILDSGEHIVELTETARDYAATIASDGDLDVEPIPLGSILEQEVLLREASFPEAEFIREDTDTDVTVWADRMLSSVFRNLLNNAVQHNDKDTPRVEVSCTVRDEVVEVRIADNGPGIPDDRKEAVFGTGERGLDSPGTGLGLYLVDTLVTQYDGDVRAEDGSPTGTVFVVELPRAE